MELPKFKRIDRSALKDAPDWVDQLLRPLNSFMSTVFSTLDRGITFGDNIRSMSKTLSFTTPSDYATGGWDRMVFQNELRAAPFCVTIASIRDNADDDPVLLDSVSVHWTPDPDGIKIRRIAGLQPDTSYTVTLLVL